MNELLVRGSEIAWREIAAGVERGELRSGKPGAGTALLRFVKGSVVGDHVHPGGEELFLVSGSLRVGLSFLLPGDYLYTQCNGINDAEALEDSLVLQMQPEPMRFVRSAGQDADQCPAAQPWSERT
jgi:quercetin dioxygenase-like cupin family protein